MSRPIDRFHEGRILSLERRALNLSIVPREEEGEFLPMELLIADFETGWLIILRLAQNFTGR